MNRAAVLIGVNKVKGRNQSLPMLNDAVRGAQAMRDWALDQGFDQALVKCFVDDNGVPRDVLQGPKDLRPLDQIGGRNINAGNRPGIHIVRKFGRRTREP